MAGQQTYSPYRKSGQHAQRQVNGGQSAPTRRSGLSQALLASAPAVAAPARQAQPVNARPVGRGLADPTARRWVVFGAIGVVTSLLLTIAVALLSDRGVASADVPKAAPVNQSRVTLVREIGGVPRVATPGTGQTAATAPTEPGAAVAPENSAAQGVATAALRQLRRVGRAIVSAEGLRRLALGGAVPFSSGSAASAGLQNDAPRAVAQRDASAGADADVVLEEGRTFLRISDADADTTSPMQSARPAIIGSPVVATPTPRSALQLTTQPVQPRATAIPPTAVPVPPTAVPVPPTAVPPTQTPYVVTATPDTRKPTKTATPYVAVVVITAVPAAPTATPVPMYPTPVPAAPASGGWIPSVPQGSIPGVPQGSIPWVPSTTQQAPAPQYAPQYPQQVAQAAPPTAIPVQPAALPPTAVPTATAQTASASRAANAASAAAASAAGSGTTAGRSTGESAPSAASAPASTARRSEPTPAAPAGPAPILSETGTRTPLPPTPQTTARQQPPTNRAQSTLPGMPVPTDAQAAQTGPLTQTAPAEPSMLEQLAARALIAVNAARAQAGALPLARSATLDTASALHAQYDVTTGQAEGNFQTRGNPLFVGETPSARFARVAGARSPAGERVAEVMALGETEPERAVQGWLDSVYHRVLLLDLAAQSAGFGQYTAGSATTSVMDLGGERNVANASGWFPASGATNVPTRCACDDYAEASGRSGAYGYPVTLLLGQIRPEGMPTIARLSEGNEDGPAVAAQLVDAYGNPTLLPQAPLKANTKYVVRMAWTNGPSVSWSFATGQ